MRVQSPGAAAPYLHSLLAERNLDGSPKACEPSSLVDVELSSETPPTSELQCVARFGLVPEIPIGDSRFLGVGQQLPDLVHTVPPAPGQGVVDWLLSIPHPEQSAVSPPYPVEGGSLYSAATLNCVGLWSDGQSWSTDHKDSRLSLANRVVVVGDSGSLEDACLFWNLRANRSFGPLPAWITREQAELPEVRSAIATAAEHTPNDPGPPTGGVDHLHFVSSTEDTKEVARSFSEHSAVGWAPGDWIDFVDRRQRCWYGRSKESMFFAEGHTSFLVSDKDLPCPRPTQITVDIEIEAFRPPPTRVQLSGTNGPQSGRFGEAVLPLNRWTAAGGAEEASLGYPRTFEVIKRACEDIGVRPVFDRKAALTYGVNRILADDYSAHMILRAPIVLEFLRFIIESERIAGDTERRLIPKGVSFGAVHSRFGDQKLARLLLSWFLHKGLVFRGLKLECTECGTQSWYSLNDIGNFFRCVGCQGQQPFDLMPEGAAWRYRVNHLLASALDQGVLQQVLAASDMDVWRPSGSRSYMFPNVILTETQTGAHLREVDLLGFANGEWLAAECKAGGDPTESELEALRHILNRLGGGSLLLVRASTATSTCDGLVDRVLIWDQEPITQEPIGTDELLKYLDPN